MTTGNGETQQLPESRVKTVEAGLALFQQVQAERDDLRNQLREAHETITRQRVEVESLQQLYNMLESHINGYMMQRDEAVAQRSAYETLFATIQAQLRVFNLPSVPLVKEIADATTSRLDPHSGHLPSLDPIAGSGQRAAVPDERAGAGAVPRRSPVLAHPAPVLGQPAGGAKTPGPRR